MPLLKFDAEQAWKNLRTNKESNWPSKRRGSARLHPVAQPSFTSGYSLSNQDEVFTIGSCFARNIEEALCDLGLKVITSQYSVPESEWEGRANGILNKYHPYAMLNELVWALQDGNPFPFQDSIMELGPDQWIDLHLPGSAKPVSYQRAIERRQEIIELYGKVRQSRVVILTPGLIEAWWDKQAGCYTNQTIQRALVQKHPGRFELHMLSYQDVYTALSSAVALLLKHCRPDVRIFFSVSPVPLAATFTEKDVLIANTYSKSVLRAAVEQVVAEHAANVEYFPSYESITLSDREAVYGDDYIHVKEEAVRENILRFVSALQFDLANTSFLETQRKPAQKRAKPLRGMVSDRIQGNVVTGWALRNDNSRPARVQLLIDGKPSGVCECTEMRQTLLDRGMHPTGRCGFSFRLGMPLRGGEEIQVLDEETGQPLRNSPFRHQP